MSDLGYDPNNWYWVVGGSATHVYSSAEQDYVLVSDATYLAWVASGGVATVIATHAELVDVLVQAEVAVPDNRDLPLNGILGLACSANYSTKILTVGPGAVMDSTGTVLLKLDSSMTKNLDEDWTAGTAGGGMMRVLLGGTITATTGSVAGTGTSFTTDFEVGSTISVANGNGLAVTSITSDTALGTGIALGGSGVAYYRGILDTEWTPTGTFDVWITIARNDATGVCDIFCGSDTIGNIPDLPSGYTFYRRFTLLIVNNVDGAYRFLQSLHMSYSPYAFEDSPYLTFGEGDAVLLPNSETIHSYIDGLTEQTAPTTTDYLLGIDDSSSPTAKKYRATVLSRERLFANRTYYVRTDGSDSNTGLVDSAGGAFKTLQKAYNTILTLDLGGYTVTVSVGDGTYTGGLSVSAPWVAGVVTFQGNTTTPSNVLISTSGTTVAVSATLPGLLTFTGFKFASSAANGLAHTGTGQVRLTKVDFGACASLKIMADGSDALVFINGNYTDSGNAIRHFSASHGAFIKANSITITESGTPAYSGAYAYASDRAGIECVGTTFSGSATGARFYVDRCSVINTNSGGANFFPGNAAGTGTNPGASPYGLYV